MPSSGCGEGEAEAAQPRRDPPPPPPPAPPPPGSGGPRLCGYLQRLSGKGPLRGFRSRWFVFDARRCALYYFRGPQEAQPLGRLDVAAAAFTYHQPEAAPPPPPAAFSAAAASVAFPAAAGDPPEPGPGTAFEIHSPGGAVTVLKAATHQDMTYWLQELQQKRWEYCNSRDAAKRDSQTSPTPSDFSKGLVAKDNADLNTFSPNASAERARNVLAVQTAPTELVGEQAACQPAPGQASAINFSLKQWGTEIKNSLKTGRGANENRRSVFYTEEWEMLDPTPKDLEESLAQEEKKRPAAEPSKGVQCAFVLPPPPEGYVFHFNEPLIQVSLARIGPIHGVIS